MPVGTSMATVQVPRVSGLGKSIYGYQLCEVRIVVKVVWAVGNVRTVTTAG